MANKEKSRYEEPRRSKFDARIATLDLEYGVHERQLAIDKHHLDDALAEQPSLYAKVSSIYAEVLSMHDGMKEREKLKESGAQINLRKKYENTGAKFTEASIKAETELDYDRRDAMKRFLELVRELARWEGLKEAYRERGYALRELASLWVANYYSNASARGESVRQAQDKQLEDNRKKLAAKRRDLSEQRRSK